MRMRKLTEIPKWHSTLKKEIRSINHNYEKINYGACGVFSYYLSIVLDKHGIKNKIVYIPEKNTPKGAYRCDVKFEHILVDIGSHVIDNNGFFEKCNNLFDLDRNKLHQMINEPRLWSNEFDWKRKENLIKSILDIKL